MKSNACWLPLVLLMACGAPEDSATQPAPDPVTVDTTTEPSPQRDPSPVRAEIRLGQFDSDVTDLAAWEAQPFGFQSFIFAANGPSGITTVRADGGGAETIAGEPHAVLLATVQAPDAEALLITAAADGLIEARALSDLSAAPRSLATISAPRDLCSNGSLVIAVGGSGATVVVGETELPIDTVPAGMLRCSVSDGEFYFQSADGWDRLTASGLEPTPLNATSSALVHAGSQVFAAGSDSSSGALTINQHSVKLQTPEGEDLRPLMVEPAYGNFGGVMRDGALIVLDEQRNLYLVGWAGIANALDLPGQLASVRTPMASGDTDFDGPEDSIELELREPGFEEQEAPLPPGQNQ